MHQHPKWLLFQQKNQRKKVRGKEKWERANKRRNFFSLLNNMIITFFPFFFFFVDKDWEDIEKDQSEKHDATWNKFQKKMKIAPDQVRKRERM